MTDVEKSRTTIKKSPSRAKQKKQKGHNEEGVDSDIVEDDGVGDVPAPEQEHEVVNPGQEGYYEGRKYCAQRIVSGMAPIEYLMLIIGRWPFTHTKNNDGTYTYNVHWYHPRGIFFVLISMYYLYLITLGSLALAFIFVYLASYNEHTYENITTREELTMIREGYLIQRNFVQLISIYSALVICVASSICVFIKPTYMMNYFSFWTRAVQTMHMDVGKGTLTKTWTMIILVLGVLLFLIISAALQFGACTSGAPILVSIMTYGIYQNDMLCDAGLSDSTGGKRWTFPVPRLLGGIGFIIIFLGAKVFALLYILISELLRNSFASWNGRSYAAILRGGEYTQTKEGRTTYTLLFKDHCILLDLIEGTNRFFGGILETYFICQIVSLCFELYAIIRTLKARGDQDDAFNGGVEDGYYVREHDFIPYLVVFILNMTVLYQVSLTAALVGEEAIAGLEVIRRKTMLGRKTDEELFFMLSMYTSYISYRKIELSAGGYFYINKEFVVTIISTIFSYFIILYQFSPRLDASADVNSEHGLREREAMGKFYVYLENGKYCSWLTTDAETDCSQGSHEDDISSMLLC